MSNDDYDTPKHGRVRIPRFPHQYDQNQHFSNYRHNNRCTAELYILPKLTICAQVLFLINSYYTSNLYYMYERSGQFVFPMA